ncbi:MAG: hypothetical protein L6R39_005080, partial [Caloplaca ligustica]
MGDLLQVLNSRTARILLGHEENECVKSLSISDHGWMKQLAQRADALINSHKGAGAETLLEELYKIGDAALNAFLQSNVTGPSLPWNPANVIFSEDIPTSAEKIGNVRQAINQDLNVDGEAVYKLIPNVELFGLAKCLLNLCALAEADVAARYKYIRSRVTANFWHQRLLSETAPTLQESIYQDLNTLEEDLHHKCSEEEARRLVQRATIHTQHGFDQKAREDLAQAARETGFVFKLTGRLGKRTKFQEKDLSQLVVLAKSADSVKNGSGVESDGQKNDVGARQDNGANAASRPENLDLNDDTLLESIDFSKSVSVPSLDKEADIAPSLAALDPSNQPTLQPLDSIILLAYASSVTNTLPADGLTREETLPYALRVLQDGSSNWQIYTQALLVRSRIEGYRSRTVERSVLQLQALVDQVIVETTANTSADHRNGENNQDATPPTFFPKPKPSESASSSERLRYIHELASPTRWELEAELASRWVSLGGLRTALEIYERLQMWAEVALCWAANDREDKARKIIRQQLFTSSTTDVSSSDPKPTIDDDDDTSTETLTVERTPLPPDAPRLFCILGDLEKLPQWFERAWDVSNNRYARAQRSLGKYYFTHGDLRKADEAYAKSLKVNAINHSTWFSLGCVRLQLGDWTGAVDAFGRAIQIEDKDAESWSNLAAALVQLDPPSVGVDNDGPTNDVPTGSNDDEEDILAAHAPKPDPQKHIREAFTALKRAAALNRDSYRIWQNLLNVSVKLSPPPYTDIIVAQTRLIELRGKSEGEKCVDVEVMEGLVAHLIATSPSPSVNTALSGEPEGAEQGPTKKRGFESMLVDLVQNRITPLITSSRRLWLLTAKLSLHLQKPLATLQAYEKAWRVTLNQPGWERGTKESKG